MVERSDRMWSTGEGNGKPLQYSCLENPMNSMKRQNDRILKEELPRSVSAQYATGDQWRNNSRKNEGMEPKQKQYPVVDVTGYRCKVQCCKDQYCIGTWNIRSMNQGKLEVVKQEIARVYVNTHLEPDILECEVKWALESITMNKASGGNGTPVELFQILTDDTVKVLHSICQQLWKIQQWPQDWKRSVFIPIPRKGNAKECSNYCTIALISHASKVMHKILQARLQQYVNRELPDVQAGFRKGKGTRDQIVSIRCIMEKAREFPKITYFCFIDYAKALGLCRSQ